MGAARGFSPTGQSKGSGGSCCLCIVPMGAAESLEGPSDGWALPEPQFPLHQRILYGGGISPCFPTGQLCSQAASTLRALMDHNGPEQPHLSPTPTPMSSGAHLSSALAAQPSLGCLAGLQLGPICSHGPY